MANRAYDVFISHVRSDSDIARGIASALRGRGLKVWTDEELLAGDDWDVAVQRAMEESRSLVLLVSQDYVNGSWTAIELGAALNASRRQGKRLVPVLVGAVRWAELPFGLRAQQHLSVDRESVDDVAGVVADDLAAGAG